MKIIISDTKEENGRIAAEMAIEILRKILSSKPKARFIAATGVSQFEFLNYLCKTEEIDWSRTEMFHLDEYIGLSASHPASFRKFLKERLVDKVHPSEVYFIKGDAPDPLAECQRVGNLISQEAIDVAFIGIGENGHIAFNDPPADFDTEEPFIIVNLDKKCQNQQIGEGWFSSMDEVPKQAISMSVRQILKSKIIICICPDKRKAEIVHNCLSINTGISPECPASILKQHNNAYIFLDKESASLLKY